jgi:tRNA(Arg) A34 adenosine deaminase TadA
VATDSEIIRMLATLATDTPAAARAKLAACVVYRGQIMSWGVNQYKSHPFQRLYGKNQDAIFFHAEVDCIYRATKRLTTRELSRSTIYVARVKQASNRSRELITALARPCVGCSRCIAAFHIRRVVYTNNEGGFSDFVCD